MKAADTPIAERGESRQRMSEQRESGDCPGCVELSELLADAHLRRIRDRQATYILTTTPMGVTQTTGVLLDIEHYNKLIDDIDQANALLFETRRLRDELFKQSDEQKSTIAADREMREVGAEIRKRLEGAYIICGLGTVVPPDWQVAIDAFVKSAQAQGHLARLASEGYDKLLEMEREQLALQTALSAAEERVRVMTKAMRVLRATTDVQWVHDCIDAAITPAPEQPAQPSAEKEGA